MDLLELCPELDYTALCDRIAEIVTHEEFLFFRRTDGDELNWVLGAVDGYEMHCTACGEDFFEARNRKKPAKQYEHCPRCGARISPHRWRDRARLESIQFAFHVLQRGMGRDVWFRSYQVETQRDFETGYKYNAFEYARVLYQDGGATRWTRCRSWYFGVTNWERKGSVNLKRWHGHMGHTREDYFHLPDADELRGSCLQYAMVQEAFDTLADPVAYLAQYVKYPALEWLWKLDLGHWLRQREQGCGKEFLQIVNLRSREPGNLLRLTRQELRLIREFPAYRVECAAMYLRLRKAGAAQADRASLVFAEEISSAYRDFFALAERAGTTPRVLRKYYNKQSGRSGRTIRQVTDEHWDYLDQMARMQADGDRLPRDLHAAHARRSARERKLKNRDLNGAFRARRRLLRWLCWRHGGMFIRPVDSPEEIIREGEQQDNCVAGYARAHAEGRRIILLLRRADKPCESWHTVELDPMTLTCRQCYGYRNAERTAEAAAFMEAYLDHIKAISRTRRTA